MKTITTSMTLLAITFAVAISIPEAQAHDSTSNIMTLYPFDADDGTQKIWYDMDDLGDVTLDGESNAAGIRLMAEVSRAALDSTDMDVTESTSYVHRSDNRLDARQYSSANIFGQTLPYGDTEGPDMYKVIWLNKNDDLNYRTSAGCTNWLDLVNPQYILNHEFGHLAGLNHHTWWPFDDTHTAMKSGCNPGQASLRAEDRHDINDWYD